MTQIVTIPIDPRQILLVLCGSGISFRYHLTLGHIKRSHGYIVIVYHIYLFLYVVVLCSIIYIAISFIMSICSQQKYVKRNRLDIKYDHRATQFTYKDGVGKVTMPLKLCYISNTKKVYIYIYIYIYTRPKIIK